MTKGTASKSSSTLTSNTKRKDLKEIVREARVKFDNKEVREETNLDQRFEKARKNHGQIRTFCMDRSKNKQIKNSQVNL